MKKLFFLTLTTLISIGCGSSAPIQTSNNTTVTSSASNKDELTSRSHTAENQAPANFSGPPMKQVVDVSELTAKIKKAESEFTAKSSNSKAKEDLANAYFQRAFALTKAAQYSAALGDFRKGLKLKPDDQEAKKMHDEIIRIYQSMKREVPKEGEEKEPESKS